jgi:hypothetical protein
MYFFSTLTIIGWEHLFLTNGAKVRICRSWRLWAKSKIYVFATAPERNTVMDFMPYSTFFGSREVSGKKFPSEGRRSRSILFPKMTQQYLSCGILRFYGV